MANFYHCMRKKSPAHSADNRRRNMQGIFYVKPSLFYTIESTLCELNTVMLSWKSVIGFPAQNLKLPDVLRYIPGKNRFP